MLKNTKKGFTIIEVVTYLGLFSVVLTIVLSTFYFVTTTIVSNQVSLRELEEVNFISSKINYLISSAILIHEPQANATSSMLKLTLGSFASENISIFASSSSVLIKRGSGYQIMLNSAQVQVSNLQFIHYPRTDFSTESIAYSFNIGGRKIPTTTVEISRHE